MPIQKKVNDKNVFFDFINLPIEQRRNQQNCPLPKHLKLAGNISVYYNLLQALLQAE
jgi:hypothetical protein